MIAKFGLCAEVNPLEVFKPINHPDRENWDSRGMDYKWGETDHNQASEMANLAK